MAHAYDPSDISQHLWLQLLDFPNMELFSMPLLHGTEFNWQIYSCSGLEGCYTDF